MPQPISNPELVCLAGVISLTLYAVMGGADYGGGFWDLMASGPRKAEQRKTIAKAIGPIWEANHVWLILMVVLLFSCFPSAFYAVSIALHIPITFLLFGIVLRGSAFTFRTYDSHSDEVQERWGRVFAISSTITPIMLGVIVGAISNGTIVTEGNFANVYLTPWLQVFPLSVGIFALFLFAYLAAVYLCSDTEDIQLQNDFRLRASISSGLSALLALSVFFLAKDGAPDIYKDLNLIYPLLALTAAIAITTLVLLFKRKFRVARYCAAIHVALVLWGWAFAQYPYLIRPAHTIDNSAANATTINLVIVSLLAGAFLLVPAFYYLYKIFKMKKD